MTINETDIAVIGAGPAGLFFVFEAGMLKLRCHVIDTLDYVGGQCTALYPEKPIYDIPAFPRIEAADLIENLRLQASPFNPKYHMGQRVESLQKNGDETFTLQTTNGTKIKAKAVVIAAGCGAFGPNRPPIEGIEEYEGRSVHYMVARKELFRDKKVVIAGGGDSAVDWAILLSEIASKVYVVHRRDKFRAAPESVAQMRSLAGQGCIEMVIPYQLEGLRGKSDHSKAGMLEAVIVKTLEGEERALEADYLLPFFGLSMELGPIAEWGLGLEKNHITANPLTLETSTPGIYAIGDIATYEKKLKLILCGFHEAAMAAHHIYHRINPDEVLHFQYSTSKGINAI